MPIGNAAKGGSDVRLQISAASQNGDCPTYQEWLYQAYSPLQQLARAPSPMHHKSMQIREATADDAAEACQVLRRSITELCNADHMDDPVILEDWLSNKTPANVRSWIVRADNHVFVATEGSTILAVGAATSFGEITLNYVSPDARFAGVSKALLNRLEAKTLELGNNTCTLTSTETARRFYLSAGYKQQSSSKNLLATSSSYLMIKQLSPVHG